MATATFDFGFTTDKTERPKGRATIDPLVKAKDRMLAAIEKQKGLIDQPSAKGQIRWFFMGRDNKARINVRYGRDLLKLPNGDTALVVGDKDKIEAGLNKIKEAVLAGVFDDQMLEASAKVSARLHGKKKK